HRGGKSGTAFDLSASSGQHFLKRLVFLLAGENLQALHQRKTGIDHDRKLARENGQLLRGDAAAEAWDIELLALLAHLRRRDLLTLEKAREFGLARRGHDAAHTGTGAIGPAIFVIRHCYPPKISLAASLLSAGSPEKLSFALRDRRLRAT